jgi:hypothetical protein
MGVFLISFFFEYPYQNVPSSLSSASSRKFRNKSAKEQDLEFPQRRSSRLKSSAILHWCKLHGQAVQEEWFA